jgi:hypothetical protein
VPAHLPDSGWRAALRIKSKFPTSSRQVHPQAALPQKADVARAGDRSRPPDRAGILAETRRSKARRALIAGLVYPNPSARKIEFDKRFKARISVPVLLRKIFIFRFSELCGSLPAIPPRRRGRIAIVTTREAGLRWTRGRCETSIVDADGEVLWSLCPALYNIAKIV